MTSKPNCIKMLFISLLLLSVGIWPVLTALPALLVAFGTNMVLAQVLGSVEDSC